MNTHLFIEKLLQASPELKEAYKQHLADNDELLPHVFLGDVTRFAILESAKIPHSKSLMILLDQIELGLIGGEKELEELIVVSFVENLCGEDESLIRVIPIMGVNLKREVKSVCGYS